MTAGSKPVCWAHGNLTAILRVMRWSNANFIMIRVGMCAFFTFFFFSYLTMNEPFYACVLRSVLRDARQWTA